MDTSLKLWKLKKIHTINNLNNMEIKISEIEQGFKDIFEEEDGVVNTVESVYEMSLDEKFYKLVISIHGLSTQDTSIIHTKFIFKTDLDKRNIIDNSYSIRKSEFSKSDLNNDSVFQINGAGKIYDIVYNNKLLIRHSSHLHHKIHFGESQQRIIHYENVHILYVLHPQ